MVDVLTPRPSRRPRVLPVLLSFPVAGFAGALMTDIAYARTANVLWADFSDWLLAVGLLFAVLAALWAIITLIASRAARARWPGWGVAAGAVLVLVAGLFDNLVHSRDGWTAVVPTGLALSAVTVLLMLATLVLAATERPARRVGAVA